MLTGLAELAVRFFGRHIDPLSIFVTSPQLRLDTQGDATSGMFEFDPLLCWRLRANLRGIWWDFTPVTTNARHLRMDREISEKKGLRIVVLGDSVTFGYRVPVALRKDAPGDFRAEEKPYPQLVAERLRAQFAGRDIEVLPLACPGYTSTQGLAWLRRDIASLAPDMVLACFGWNDIRAAGLPDRMTMPAGGAQVLARQAIGSSQLLLHIAASAQQRTPPSLNAPQPEPRTSDEEYVANLLEMRSLCAARGAWFGIVLPVYRDPNTPGIVPEHPDDPGSPEEALRMTRYRDKLREAAAREGISALEIPELTERSWPANRTLFGERIHPNAAGHALMAERITDFIAPVVRDAQSK